MSFSSLLQLLLCKSVKSIQLVLNEWTERLGERVSASAFSQARLKLRHTAFLELSEKAVIEVMYSDSNYQTFKGHRLLAIDGTSLRLPNTGETRATFGLVENTNGRGKGRGQVEAKAVVLFDVLNRIPLSANLEKGRTSEIKAARMHLAKLKKGDLLLADRAFGSYQFFAEILGQNADFVVRCKEKTYDSYHGLFSNEKRIEHTVELQAPSYLSPEDSIPKTLTVRFIRVLLSTGEVEILATSLLDKKKYSYNMFKELYYKRWNVETYFHVLKSRLSIENFTGKSVEAVLQDFYSTLFVSGLESIITQEAEEELEAKEVQHPQRVNKAVSFHAIKNEVVRMIFEQEPDIHDKMKQLFLVNPTLSRPDRASPPRNKSHATTVLRSAHFQRCVRKHVF